MSGLYARISTGLLKDDKILAVGPMAELLYIRIILFCKEELSDGYITSRQLPLCSVGVRNVQRSVSKLLDKELLECWKCGYRIPPEKWKKYQTTAEEVAQLKEKRALAGKRGAESRWGKNGKGDGKCHTQSHMANDGKRWPEPEPEAEINRPIPNITSEVKSERGGDVTSIGSGLGSAFGDFNQAEDRAKKSLWVRVAKIQPKGPWLEWWRALLPRIWEHGEALTELYDAVKHVEDSLSEELREAKGIGAAEAPDRLLVSKALELCRRHKVAWPEFPSQRTPKRGKSRTTRN